MSVWVVGIARVGLVDENVPPSLIIVNINLC